MYVELTDYAGICMLLMFIDLITGGGGRAWDQPVDLTPTLGAARVLHVHSPHTLPTDLHPHLAE